MTKPFAFWIRFVAVISLFGAFTCAAVLTRKARAEEPSASQVTRSEISIGSDLERLFNPIIFSPPTSFQGAEVRRWRDNTGTYEVEGRLGVIFADKVRIIKTNGRTTTVSMNRLSEYDQGYVRWVASHLMNGSVEAVEYADNRGQVGNPAR